MKTLIAYSSLTNNTKKVAVKLKEYISEADLKQIKEVDNIDEYEYIIVGGWIDQGTYNLETRKFVEKIKDKKTSFFFTLGAYPNSMHASKCLDTIEKLFVTNNNIIVSHWHCQGALSQAVIERRKKLLKERNQELDEVRVKRWQDAAKHPNQEDYNSLLSFVSYTNKTLKKMEE